MREWAEYRLTDVAAYYNGLAFKPLDWSEDGLPIIRIEQLNNPTGPSDKFLGEVPEVNRVRDGDLLFSWSATLKVVIWKHGDGALNQHLFKVIPKQNFDLQFVFYLLEWCMDALSASSHGSTMKHIRRSELQKFKVRIPQVHCQKRVSRVLGSIDALIERTEALIAKHQQIKAGLMHDLFTRGLTDGGAPRPSRTQSANRYKETSIGWIPAEWSVDPLGTQVEIIDPNPSHRYPDDVAVGVPICSTENFAGEDDFDLSKSKLVPVSAYTEQEQRCRFKPADVVFARKGRIGLARRYGEARKAFSHTVVLLKPKAGAKVDESWLLWAVRAHWFLGGIERTMNSNSGVPTLGVDFIAKVVVPFPPIAEQTHAAKVLDQVSNYLRELRADLKKLRTQKTGLMQDLLTGKVAIPAPATEATNA